MKFYDLDEKDDDRTEKLEERGQSKSVCNKYYYYYCLFLHHVDTFLRARLQSNAFFFGRKKGKVF
jgi:hypothetical protein